MFSGIFAAMALFLAMRMELTSGLVHFLSNEGDRELAGLSRSLADSGLTRGMVLVISSGDLTISLAAAATWQAVLRAHPEVERISSGPNPDLADAVRTLYFDRRFASISDDPELEFPSKFDDAGLRSAALRLREILNLPEGALFKDLAPADPLFFFGDLLNRFRLAQMGTLDVVSGQFAAIESKKAVLFLTTHHSPFASSHQAPLDAYLLESFSALNDEYDGGLVLERAGVHGFSVASEQSATRDAARITLFSVLGIVLLFIVLFRSPALLGIAVLPLVGGLLTAATGSLILFGELHLMTLVFGATLLGVCLDYPIHYACYHTLVPQVPGGASPIQRVWGAIAMGGATTLAGFAGLAWADFPGVREIGVFSALGIVGALATTRLLLPALMPPQRPAPEIQRRAARGLASILDGMGRRRALLLVPVAVAALVCLVGLPRLVWEDDIFSLSAPVDPIRSQEDERVRNLVSQMDAGRFIVALGSDDEEALQTNDAIHKKLLRAKREGLLEDFRSLHVFVSSTALQEKNQLELSRVPDLASRTLAALSLAGFRPQAFGSFTRALEESHPPPLRIEDLTRSALADLIIPFRLTLTRPEGESVALLTFLKGVRNAEALEATLGDIAGARFFDQRAFLSSLYRGYRERTSLAIGIGLIAVTLLLAIRYRDPRVALATFLPAALAAATTIGLLSLFGVKVNLIHLLGLLLVLSVGVDYSIFLVSARDHREETPATLLSLCIACTSTCLAFGLLALSSFPALRALGLVTGIGVLLSLLFAPLVLAGLGRGKENQ